MHLTRGGPRGEKGSGGQCWSGEKCGRQTSSWRHSRSWAWNYDLKRWELPTLHTQLWSPVTTSSRHMQGQHLKRPLLARSHPHTWSVAFCSLAIFIWMYPQGEDKSTLGSSCIVPKQNKSQILWAGSLIHCSQTPPTLSTAMPLWEAVRSLIVTLRFHLLVLLAWSPKQHARLYFKDLHLPM